ncbi:MAG: substrate-binding domain-containing protein [Clostridia bacterium]|nr:substrate-binding domain-containing protein [Clostridia bacterium]
MKEELFVLSSLFFLVLGIIFVFPKKTRIFGKIMLSIGLFIFLAIVGLFGAVVISLMAKEVYGYFVLAGTFLLYLLIFCSIFGFIKKKAVWIPYVCILCALILGFMGMALYDSYESSVPVMTDRGDLLYEYSPENVDSKVALLSGESELKLESELPVMDGATALYPIYSAFANAVYPKGEYESVCCSGTTDAYESIVDGGCDIIFAAAPSEKQLEYAKSKGIELELKPIGYEGFVFFVNSKNPIDGLTVEQIKDIYSGRVTNWNELGAYNLGKIKAFQRDEGSGSQSALLRLMNGDTLMKAPQNVVDSMGGIIVETADYKNYKNAIGFSFRFYSTEMVQNDQIKLLELNGVYPSGENIENGSYPLTSNFYMVTRKGDVSENTQMLMNWILSEQGMELIEKTGYTPVKKSN